MFRITNTLRRAFWPACLALLLAGAWSEARGQSGSLYGDAATRRPLQLSQSSWIYQPAPEPKEVRIHDLVTVIVDVKAQVMSDGQIDRRKKADGKLTLKDWVLLKRWAAIPDPQSLGDPTIAGAMENKYRAEADLETSEAMKLRMACEVIDIRPNGTLVLEGHRSIQVNSEVWEVSLSGIAPPEAILPNNTILSENMAEIRLIKREAGHVRDGYRRGWMMTILDRFQPF